MSGVGLRALAAIRAQPPAAFGLLILLVWSIAAVGAIGDGAGWMRIGRYGPAEAFEAANLEFAEARAADALDGQPVDLTGEELTALLTQPQVYGELVSDPAVIDKFSSHIRGLIEDGALAERLTSGFHPLLQVSDGRFALAPRSITAITPRPLVTASLERPSWRHWLGTNRAGNDIYAGIIDTAWIPLMIGFLGALFGVAAGAAIGWLQRRDGRTEWLDGLIGGVYAFPPILLLLLFVTYVEYGQIWFAVVLAPFALVPAARAARDAESVRGAAAPLLGLFGVMMATFALIEAGTSFVGFGLGGWGRMIADGRQFVVQAPWWSLFAGLALISVAFAAFALGRGLQRLVEHDPT